MAVFCPYCGWPAEFDFTFYERSYYHCSHCDLIFRLSEVRAEEIRAYYRERYFDDHAQDQLSGARISIFRNALRVIEKHLSPGFLLDVGCGIGQFLKEAKERGWEVLGVDPSEKSIERAKALVGDYVVLGTLDDVPEGRAFDCVTMINVLDHMVDGGRQLRKAYHRLKRGGLLYLRIPNGYLYANLRRWAARNRHFNFVNRYLVFHEYVITPLAIENCLRGYGYRDVTVRGDRLSFSDCRQAFRVPPVLVDYTLKITFLWLKILERASRGRMVLSPSLYVVAWKK